MLGADFIYGTPYLWITPIPGLGIAGIPELGIAGLPALDITPTFKFTISPGLRVHTRAGAAPMGRSTDVTYKLLVYQGQVWAIDMQSQVRVQWGTSHTPKFLLYRTSQPPKCVRVFSKSCD